MIQKNTANLGLLSLTVSHRLFYNGTAGEQSRLFCNGTAGEQSVERNLEQAKQNERFF